MTSLLNKASAALSNELVLVTGCSGFVATDVALEFMNAGYKVRGTFRSQDKADDWAKVHGSKGLFESAIVEDIVAEGGLDQACQGVTIVAHTASPFHFNVQDPDSQMLQPAYNGTLNALKSAKKAGTVQRFVVTSSFAAILDMNKTGPEFTYTSEDWNPATRELAIKSDQPPYIYCASKKIAEEAMWTFVKNEKPQFACCAINPPMIFGPPQQVIKSLDSLNTSAGAIWSIIDAKELPAATFPVFTDVRDIAKMHFYGATKDVTKGQRYLCVSGYYNNDTVADIIARNFPDQKHRVPAYDQSKVGKVGAGHFQTDSSKCQKDLGIEFIPLEKCVVDSAARLFELEKQIKA